MKRVIHICLSISIMAIVLMGPYAMAAEYKYNMSYIYFGSYANYTNYVDEAKGSLNEISPSYFDLNSDGSLLLTPSLTDIKESEKFIKNMHDKGMLVVPFISNHWNYKLGKAALDNRHDLVVEIALAVEKYDLDGVNVDIENMTGAERTAYVDFVALLRKEMPDKLITVSVAAIQSDKYTTQWQKSYDYEALALSSDYLMIMAYDEHYQSGPAGPVSSISFIEKSIQYALDHGVPKEKIVLGLPFYGRIWSDSGGYPKGYGVSNSRIDQLISLYDGTVSFDEAAQSSKVTITVDALDEKPTVGGKALAAGTYTIWYECDESIKSKLALVTEYDLKGTGSWSLGQECDSTWDYYKYWLNDCKFEDIQSNWAKDYILEAYVNEWITGVTSDSFKPDESLTRAQAAAMLVRILGLDLQENAAYSFDDCKGNWAEDYINTARKNNIVSGTGGNQFSPDSPVTRQEMAVMLNNILGFTSSGSIQVFSDVSHINNSWSFGDIYALSQKGIITGFPDSSFRPLGKLTRAEMTAMVSRIDFS